jgi:hydrogenase maturation protease
VGLGSDIRADDGVGLHVVRTIRLQTAVDDVHVIEIGTAGLSILDHVLGYDRLILVDAIVSGAEPGTVHELRGADVARCSHLGPGHDADLPTVLALGQKLAGDRMPRDVVVVAIEASNVTTVSMELTPEVRAAVPRALELIESLCSKGQATVA